MGAATRILLLISSVGWATAALGQAGQGRDLCTDRPDLGSGACIVDSGRLVAEVGAIDWTRDEDGGSREDRLLAGDSQLRYGIGPATELRLGWTAFGHVRTRDKLTDAVERTSGVGDVEIGVRQNLRNPDGSGFAVAIQPSVTLPIGKQPIGDGDWGASLIVPVSVELSEAVTLALSPEVDAQPDEDGSGRHLRYGSVVGLTFGVGDDVDVNAEVAAFRDRDPAGHVTETILGLSAAWQPTADFQLDAGGFVGLNRNTPDVQLLAGFTKRF